MTVGAPKICTWCSHPQTSPRWIVLKRQHCFPSQCRFNLQEGHFFILCSTAHRRMHLRQNVWPIVVRPLSISEMWTRLTTWCPNQITPLRRPLINFIGWRRVANRAFKSKDLTGLLCPFIKVVTLRAPDIFDYRAGFAFLFLDVTKKAFAAQDLQWKCQLIH